MNTEAGDSNNTRDRSQKLLAELERNAAEWRTVQKLLIRVITRLTVSTSGLDPLLDVHLTAIKDLLRRVTDTAAWRAELDAATEALFRAAREIPVREQEEPPPPDPYEAFAALFRFIRGQITEPADLDALDELEERVKGGDFSDEVFLFAALERVFQEVVAKRTAPTVPSIERPALDDDAADMETIRKKLLVLLEAVDVPVNLQGRVNRLTDRLKALSDRHRLMDVFQDIVEFLVSIKISSQHEQKFLEEFLTDLTTKLSVLEQQAVGLKDLTAASEAETRELHSVFAGHVADLRETASDANDLDLLKLTLSQRLNTISQYLQQEREAQEQRLRQTEEQVEALNAKLQEMETETSDLRTKLRVQHSMAMRDALTGLPNRMAYDERIGQELMRFKRFRTPFCLLIWDVDHFKNINDRFGHKAGDRALITIAEMLAGSIRETDFVGRFGGEEFVMLLEGTTGESALTVADVIRGKIEQCGFNSHGRPVTITISCGIGECTDADSSEQLFERTDEALYRAKNEGRNRCVLAEGALSTPA